jgi:hypothetical protein
MANEFFTTRFGKQVAVSEVTIPKIVMTSIMRLQEDLEIKHQAWTLPELVIALIDLGISARRNSMKYAEQTKASKKLSAYIKAQLSAGLPIDREYAARLSQTSAKYVAPVMSIEEDSLTDTEETDLTESELEAATSPNGVI